MSFLTPTELEEQSHFVVARTQRGDDLIARDPRQMPRRLRVLLMAIDGAQTVQLYTKTLKGFGDVSELLIELIHLGMVKLVDPREAAQSLASGKSQAMTALDQMMDDGRFTSDNAAQVLYGSTTPGSFEDMMRVAAAEAPQRSPQPLPRPAIAKTTSPAPAPSPRASLAPPTSGFDQSAQTQSLFDMLESVRNERLTLKQQLSDLQAKHGAKPELEVRYKALKGAYAQAQKKAKLAWGVCAALGLITVALAFALLTR